MSGSSLYKFKDLSKEKDLQAFQRPESQEYVAPTLFEDSFATTTEQKSGIHSEIEEQMPPKLLAFSNTSEYIVKGFYTFKTSSGEEKKATRSPSKGYMKPVTDSLAALDKFLDGDIPKTAEGAVDVAALEDVTHYFLDTLAACDKYLDKRKNPWTDEGKARYAMVSDIREKVSQESVKFADRIEKLKADPKSIPEDGKWISILTDIRTEKYEDGKDDVTISSEGGGTSDVIVIEKKGVKQYIKENEKVPTARFADVLTQEIDRIKKDKKILGENDPHLKNQTDSLMLIARFVDRKYDSFYDPMLQDLDNYFYDNDIDVTPEKVTEYLMSSFSEIKTRQEASKKEYDELKAKDEEIEKQMKALEDAQKQDSPEYKELQEKSNSLLKQMDQSDYLYMGHVVMKMKKNRQMRLLATKRAGIKDGEDLTKRNVATKRLADMLKLNDLVVDTKLADVTVGNKKINGITMGHAEGISSSEIQDMAEAEKKKVSYSPEAYKQILSLQVLDVLCGQVDRHSSNFLCSYTKDEKGNYIIDKITAIDNDLSFGNLSYDKFKDYGDSLQGPGRSIEKNGELQMPAIDYDLAINILNLKPSDLEYQMKDLLSKSEREALVDRLKGVQRVIRKQMLHDEKMAAKGEKRVSRFPKNEEEWKQNKEHYAKDAMNNYERRESYLNLAKNDPTMSESERQKVRRMAESTPVLENMSYLKSSIM